MDKVLKVMTVLIVVFFMGSCASKDVDTTDFVEVNTDAITIEVGLDLTLPICNVVDDDKECTVDLNGLDLDTIGLYTVRFYTLKETDINSNIELLNIIVEDSTPPSLEGVPESITMGLMEVIDFSQLGFVATDNYDGDISENIIVNKQPFGFLSGNYNIEVIVTDSNGNTTKKEIELIVLDVMYAEISMEYIGETTFEIGSDNYALPACSLFSDTDEFDCEINDDLVDLEEVGTYEVFYTAANNTGGVLFAIKHIVNVIDTTAPILVSDKSYTVSEVTLEFDEDIAWYSHNDELFDEFELTNTPIVNLQDGMNTITVSDKYGNTSIIENILVDTRAPEIILVPEFGPVFIKELEIDLEENEKLIWAIDIVEDKYAYLTRFDDASGMLHIRSLSDSMYNIDIQTSDIPFNTIASIVLNGDYVIVSHAAYGSENYIEVFNVSDDAIYAKYTLDDLYYGRYIASEGNYLITADKYNIGYVYKLDDPDFEYQFNLESCKDTQKTMVSIADGVGYFTNNDTNVTAMNLDTFEATTYGVSSCETSVSLDVYGQHILFSNYDKWDSYGEVSLCDLELSYCTFFHNDLGAPSNWFGFKIELNDKWILVNELYGDSTYVQDSGLLHIYDLNDLSYHYQIENPDGFEEGRFGMNFALYEDSIIVFNYQQIESNYISTYNLYEMRGSYSIHINEENIESITLTKDGEIIEFASTVYQPGVYEITVTDIFDRVSYTVFTILDLPE